MLDNYLPISLSISLPTPSPPPPLFLSRTLFEIYAQPPLDGNSVTMKPNKTDTFRLYIMKTHIPPHAEETLFLSLSLSLPL